MYFKIAVVASVVTMITIVLFISSQYTQYCVQIVILQTSSLTCLISLSCQSSVTLWQMEGIGKGLKHFCRMRALIRRGTKSNYYNIMDCQR